MRLRYALAALAALAGFAVPTAVQAQKPVPVAPSHLLAQRTELGLTPHQVRELSLLAAQVRRYQQAVLRAPSKPWIATTRGTPREVASARALELLTPQQRELAMRVAADTLALGSSAQTFVLID